MGRQRRPRRLRWIKVLVFTACVTAVGSGGARAAERVALLPIEGAGLMTKTRDDVDATLRTALASAGLDVQSKSATDTHIVEAQQAGLTNCSLTDDPCAVQIGQVAEVDAVFRADVTTIDNRTVLRLSRVPTSGGGVATRLAGEVRLPDADQGASIAGVVKALLSGAASAGPLPLVIRVTPTIAVVTIDDKDAPARSVWLTPGSHTFGAKADGYLDLHQDVVVRADGVNSEIALTLEPRPSSLSFALLAAGGVAFVVGGTGAGVVEIALNQPMDIASRDTLRVVGFGSLLAAGAGLAGAAVGGALLAGSPE